MLFPYKMFVLRLMRKNQSSALAALDPPVSVTPLIFPSCGGAAYGEGKFKFGIFPGRTADGYRSAVKLYYGADYGQPQSNTRFILAP